MLTRPIPAPADLRENLDVSLERQQCGQGLADHGLVFGDEHSYFVNGLFGVGRLASAAGRRSAGQGDTAARDRVTPAAQPRRRCRRVPTVAPASKQPPPTTARHPATASSSASKPSSTARKPSSSPAARQPARTRVSHPATTKNPVPRPPPSLSSSQDPAPEHATPCVACRWLRLPTGSRTPPGSA
jgi:hypothetical protein